MSGYLQYHFLQGTSVVGPLGQSEIESLVQKGVVSSTSLLSSDGATWHKAAELLPKLFSAASSNKDSPKGAEQWHVQSPDGKQFGPVSFTELLSWVIAGNVTASCLVRSAEKSTWQKADEVFPQLKPRTVKPHQGAPRPQRPIPVTAVSPPPSPLNSSAKSPDSALPSSEGDGEKVLAVIGGITVLVLIWLFFAFALPHLRPSIGTVKPLIGLLILAGSLVGWIVTSLTKRR